MHLDIVIDRLTPDCAVVSVQGPLTLGTNLKVADAQVQQLVEAGVKRLVLDMGGCGYCDSAGLGFLIHTYGLIHERGGNMRLCSVGDRLMALLTMTTTDRILPIDLDRAASLLQCNCECT